MGTKACKQMKNNPQGEDLRFYESKLYTMRYFFEYELRKVDPLVERLKSDDRLTVEMGEAWFI
jgi:hypothetical protein